MEQDTSMTRGRILNRLVIASVFAGASACTVAKTATPALSGPSELGTSIALTASRDVIPRDGISQATINIHATGQGAANLTLRVDTVTSGDTIVTDRGTLSNHTVMTNSGGDTSVVFTAPTEIAPGIDDPTPILIRVLPVSSDFGSSAARYMQLRLVPPTVVVIPGAPVPSFTFSPASPAKNALILFNAAASIDLDGNIVSYTWEWGDGETTTKTNPSEDHDYSAAGTYYVTLTVTDNSGLKSSLTKAIVVN